MRALFVSSSLPHQRRTGKDQRSSFMLAALRKVAEVDVVVVDPPSAMIPEERELFMRDHGVKAFIASTRYSRAFTHPKPSPLWRALQRLGRTVEIARSGDPKRPYLPIFCERAWRRCGLDLRHYDVVVCRYLRTAARFGLIGLAKLVVDIDDDERRVLRSMLSWPNRSQPDDATLRRHLAVFEELVPALTSRIPELLVASRLDLGGFPGRRVTWLPNLPQRPVAEICVPVLPRLFTVGMGAYPPFFDGLEWFLAEVWPRVRAAVDTATMLIVSRDVGADRESRWSAVAGVTVERHVEDIGPMLAGSSAALVCNWYGGGTSIKLLEALAHRRPVVATSFSYAPYYADFDESHGVFCADSALTMAEHCVRLLIERRGPSAASAQSAREVLDRHYAPAKVEKTLRKTIERVAGFSS